MEAKRKVYYLYEKKNIAMWPVYTYMCEVYQVVLLSIHSLFFLAEQNRIKFLEV